MNLDGLGSRICILGPSNSGKSTLAAAIGRSRGLPPVHLDQLHHRPNTDWQPRPIEEFVSLHHEAIRGERWVVEGNYRPYLPQRLERATGIILLEVSMLTSLLRYFRRSWLDQERYGGLEGGRDSVKWEMIRHIVLDTRKKRKRYASMFEHIGLPKLMIQSSSELNHFYRAERLRD